MSKKNRKQLSERDLEVAKWIAEQGAVRLTTINRMLGGTGQALEPRVLRALGQRLVVNNLANKERILTGPAILWPTKESLNLAGFELKQGERIPKPSLSTLLHSILVAEVRVIYEKNGGKWTCERSLRSDFTDHLPDGLVDYHGQKIIVEIDRTRKVKNRLLNIMLINSSQSDLIVDYWVPPQLLEFLSSQRNALPTDIQNRVRLFEIPREVI